MQPENYYFGGGSTETLIHPLVLVAMILAIILIFLLPRKYVVLPFLFCAFFVPLIQTVIVGGAHLFVVRIVILAVWARLVIGNFLKPGKGLAGGWTLLDKIFLVWAFARTLAFALQFSFASGALIHDFGFLLDAIGEFYLLRLLIQDEEDIIRVVKFFAVFSGIVGASMLYERVSLINVFGYLGGVPIIPGFRDGLYRCQGPFRNPITAGSFAATVVPFFVWLWTRKAKFAAGLGLIGATLMTILSGSSTSFMAYAAGIGAIALWPMRKDMRLVRWAFVLGVCALAVVMKAPVWMLVAHIDLTGASSNYHRAMLIDQFIRHFGDWWLIGTTQNGTWAADMWDQANQYVAEGEMGGLVAFASFIAMISLCFVWLGKARKAVEGDRSKEWFLWLLGAALFSHVVAFFGIDYFDQTQVGWYTLLAVISAAALGAPAQSVAEAPAESADLVGGGVPLFRPASPRGELTARTLARR